MTHLTADPPLRLHVAARRRRADPLPQDSLLLALEQALDDDDAGPALRVRLQRYLPFLAAELEEEEGPNGFLAEILEERPALAPRVRRAKAEHREILADLRRLIGRLGRRQTDLKRCERARARLLEKLRRHRRAEERLLLDAARDPGREGRRSAQPSASEGPLGTGVG